MILTIIVRIIISIRVYAVFRQPPSFSVHNVFTKPFKNQVWMVIFLAWTAILVMFLSVLFISSKCTSNPERNSQEEWDTFLAILWSLAAFCQRSNFKVFYGIVEQLPIRCVRIYRLLHYPKIEHFESSCVVWMVPFPYIILNLLCIHHILPDGGLHSD
jgi:hypothetical protein